MYKAIKVAIYCFLLTSFILASTTPADACLFRALFWRRMYFYGPHACGTTGGSVPGNTTPGPGPSPGAVPGATTQSGQAAAVQPGQPRLIQVLQKLDTLEQKFAKAGGIDALIKAAVSSDPALQAFAPVLSALQATLDDSKQELVEERAKQVSPATTGAQGAHGQATGVDLPNRQSLRDPKIDRLIAAYRDRALSGANRAQLADGQEFESHTVKPGDDPELARLIQLVKSRRPRSSLPVPSRSEPVIATARR